MSLDSLAISPIIVLAAAVIAAIAFIVLLVLVVRMQGKINRLLGGSANAESIEQGVAQIAAKMKELDTFRSELEKYLTDVEGRLKKSIQSVQTVRFNPFKGTGSGGNQSFATAFLNQDEDGVVISSLYSREHVSVFSKPVKAGKPEFELSEEETQALKEAQAKLESASKAK